MTLTEDQIRELKRQLSEQIKNLPIEQKRQAQEQINSISSEVLETMVKQQQASREKIFRMIVNKEIESVVVEEDLESIAVLEINPLTRGHVLVIPKREVREEKSLGEGIVNFAKRIAERIKENLSPKRVKVSVEKKFGEVIIEVVPEYEIPLENCQRKQAKREELEEIRKDIIKEVIRKKGPEEIKIKKERKKKVKVLKLKRRVP